MPFATRALMRPLPANWHRDTPSAGPATSSRIIRQVSEDQTTLEFQFTAEKRDGDRFAYELETMLTLEKATGKVTCALPGLATLAQEELDHCIAARTGADVTRIVQRLFERNADLFPIRDQGGPILCHVSMPGSLTACRCFSDR
jgi:hypothetical protein